MPPSSSTRTKVFISYSRKDAAWVNDLADALADNEIDVLIDRRDIVKGEPWKERIFSLIEQADTILFVMSPSSLGSPICFEEIAYAENLNKRFVPLVIFEPVDEQGNKLDIPPALSRINYIFFTHGSDTAVAFNELMQALLTDLDWVREHTRLGGLALRWKNAGQPTSQLLRGKDLTAGELWRDRHPKEARPPTEMQLQYISQSRKSAGTRRNILAGSIITGLLIASGLGAFGLQQKNEAVLKQKIAEHERDNKLLAQSRSLANLAQEKIALGNYRAATLLSLEALPHKQFGIERPSSPEARQSLFSSTRKLDSNIVLPTYNSKIKAVRYSRNGKYVLILVEPKDHPDEGGYIYNAQNGVLVQTLTDQTEQAVFSPDSTTLATGHKTGEIKIWSLKTGKLQNSFGDKIRAIEAMAFHPDGREIAYVEKFYNAIIFRNVSSGKVTKKIEFHLNFGVGPYITFNHDGSQIAFAGGEKSAYVWTTTTGALLYELKEGTQGVGRIFFDGIGQRILTENKWTSTAVIWDQITGKEISKINLLQGNFTSDISMPFVLSNTAIYTSNTSSSILWSARNGKKLADFKGTKAGFFSDPTYIVSSEFKHMKFYDTANKTSIKIPKPDRTGWIKKLLGNPDNSSFLSQSNKHIVRIWPIKSNTGFQLKNDDITQATYNKTGDRILTSSWRDSRIELWDAKTARLISIINAKKEQKNKIIDHFFSQDGKYIIARYLRSDRLIFADSASGKNIKIVDNKFSTSQGSLIPKTNLYAVGNHKKINFWDLTTGAIIRSFDLSKASKSIDSIGFVDGQTILILDKKGVLKKIKLADMSLIAEKPIADLPYKRNYSRYKYLFNPHASSALIYSDDSKSALNIDLTTLTVTGRLDFSKRKLKKLSYSHDGTKILAVTKNTEAIVWDAQTSRQLFQITGSCKVVSAKFSLDNELVVAGCGDGFIRSWVGKSGIETRSLRAYNGTGMNALDMHPNGKDLLIAGNDVTRLSFFEPIESVKATARTKIPTCLTPEQRQQYSLAPAPPRWCIELKKHPYHTIKWRDWLEAKDRGETVPMPDTEAKQGNRS